MSEVKKEFNDKVNRLFTTESIGPDGQIFMTAHIIRCLCGENVHSRSFNVPEALSVLRTFFKDNECNEVVEMSNFVEEFFSARPPDQKSLEKLLSRAPVYSQNILSVRSVMEDASKAPLGETKRAMMLAELIHGANLIYSIHPELEFRHVYFHPYVNPEVLYTSYVESVREFYKTLFDRVFELDNRTRVTISEITLD